MAGWLTGSVFRFYSPGPRQLQIAGIPGVDLNLFANVTDVDSYRVIRGQSIFIPDALVDLRGGKNTSGIFHKKKQDIIFDGRHPYRFSIYQHLFFVIVYRKTPVV